MTIPQSLSSLCIPTPIHAHLCFSIVWSAEGGSSTTSLTWSNVNLPGGRYQLCWCTLLPNVHWNATNFSATQMNHSEYPSCTSPDDFRVDVGEVMVVGVSPMEKTCVSGQGCFLDGIHGTELSINDSWIIMDTCGLVNHILSPSAHVASSVLTSGSAITWELLTLSGGEFRLCWCSGSVECDRSDFFIDAGHFTMIGPTSMFTHTCVVGQSCTISSVFGYGLSMQDQFAIMDTCGVSEASVLNSSNHTSCCVLFVLHTRLTCYRVMTREARLNIHDPCFDTLQNKFRNIF